MKKIALLFVIVFTLQHSHCQESFVPSFIKDSIDSYVSSALTKWKIPGVAVCVVKDGKVAFMKGYGVKETGTTHKVDENTLFMIGSNTKAFTATALAMLAADKKLSLDDKVQKWLPDFTLYDPWVAKEAIIRDLLCHRLGFETFQGDFMFFDSDLSTAEMRERFGRLKPLYSFRGRWGYTNAAFMTAGEIIPKVTGKSWAEFLKEKIFLPLGMPNTLALSKDIAGASNKATAHTVWMGELRKIPYGNIDAMAAAGSISSSVHDMSKWVIAQLNNGRVEGREIIPAFAISQTWLPHSILGNGGHMYNTGHFSLYGLGWFLEEYNGKKIVSHTGGVNGFVTSVTLVPEEKLGVIVLTNTDANNFYEALKWEIIDAYMKLPFRNYSSGMLNNYKMSEAELKKMVDLKKDTIQSKPAAALPLTSYTGEYTHELYGKMNITFENGDLIMRFEHHPKRYSKLEALGGNRFLSTWNDPLFGVNVLPFTVENGRVKSLTVRVADFVEFTPYEFIKVK
ncbi:MAG TPA: serine hydrolase [Chitinophagaceae bacterium]|nr:serine hydrolase [Chitinophagaceae bacterium]